MNSKKLKPRIPHRVRGLREPSFQPPLERISDPHRDPKVYAARMLKRKEMGITWFKMDLHTNLVADRPGAVNERGVCTEKGLGYLCEHIAAIRDVIGWKAPLSADHFGPLNVKDAI